MISHGQTYYDGVVRTPLVIAAPGMPRAGRAVEELTQNIDIAPDAARHGGRRPAARLERAQPEGGAGGDRSPSPPAPPRAAFSEGAWTFWIGSVTEENRKFILVTPQERMLFDLAQRSRREGEPGAHRIRIACGRCTTSS